MKQYAIFSDVDGTIYNKTTKLLPETLEQITKAQAKGIEFIICTGNPYFQKMKDLSKQLNVDYFVGSNGAYIHDVKNDKIIKKSVMTIEESQKIIDTLIEMEIGGDWWDDDTLYANEFVIPRVRETLKKVVDKNKDLVMTHKAVENIQKLEGYEAPTPEGIAKIDELEKRLSGMGLQLARMKPQHLEITKPDVSKGDAAKFLSDHIGISLDNIMTIGDSANDHSMLKITPFGYAMGNANDITKKIAKLHTSTVEQNGLGEAILDFMFRKRLTENFDGQK